MLVSGISRFLLLAATVLAMLLASTPVDADTTVDTPWQLLKVGSGTSTSAVPVNLDTIAITGLTADDNLFVRYYVHGGGGGVSGMQLYNATDSVKLVNLTTIGDPFGSQGTGEAWLSQRQEGATKVTGISMLVSPSAPSGDDSVTNATTTTTWTGNWTLAFRITSVESASTFYYSWQVYKLRGQNATTLIASAPAGGSININPLVYGLGFLVFLGSAKLILAMYA